MSKKNQIVYEITQSDILKIIISLLSFFTVLLAVNLYHGFNGAPANWVNEKIMPWLAIGDNGHYNITRPWKIITYVFTELSFMRLLSSCIWLVFFGFIIHDLKGKNSLVSLFFTNTVILGTIVAVLSVLFPQWFKQFYYYGIEDVLLSVVAATVVYNPTYKVFTFFRGGFGVWIVGIVFLLLHLTSIYSPLQIAMSLLAIVLGLCYYYWGNSFYYSIQMFLNKNMGDFFSNNRFSETKRNIKAQQEVYKKTDITEKKMNELLDKISAHGIDSLSKQEKEWLNSASKK